jgi:hypothetical protein
MAILTVPALAAAGEGKQAANPCPQIQAQSSGQANVQAHAHRKAHAKPRAHAPARQSRVQSKAQASASASAQGASAQARAHVRAQAQVGIEQGVTASITSPRELGGFVFQPPALLEGPFIASQISMDTSAGMLKKDAVTPRSAIPGGPATYDKRVGALQHHVRLGYALLPNLGLGLDATATMIGGANNQSALQVGNVVAFDLRPSAKIGLLNDQQHGIAVGVRAYGIAVRAMGMRPAGLIDGAAREARSILQEPARIACLVRGDAACALRGGADIAEGARIDKSMLGGGLSVSAAKNIGQYVGVQVEIGGEASHLVGGNEVRGRVDATPRTIYAGTAASVDLAPIAPVGAMVEYRMDHTVVPVNESTNPRLAAGDVGRSEMHRVSGGIYYTAKRNLALGVVGTYGIVRGNMPGAPSTGVPARLMGGRLTVGYYF